MITKFKNWVLKYFYKIQNESKLSHIDFFEMKRIAEEYDKVKILISDDENNDTIQIYDKTLSIFGSNNGGVDIYYKNMHVGIIDNDKQHIVRISLKKSVDEYENEWVYKKNNKSFNVNTPVNETMNVYLYYNVNVMDDRFCENMNYMDGNWNEYVFETLMEIVDMIYGFTQYSQFSKEYKYK